LKKYRFSNRAEFDLDDILRYAAETWSDEQADVYLASLYCSHLHKGFRRIEQGRHVIFYEEDKNGIFIARILHQNRTPERHLVED